MPTVAFGVPRPVLPRVAEVAQLAHDLRTGRPSAREVCVGIVDDDVDPLPRLAGAACRRQGTRGRPDHDDAVAEAQLCVVDRAVVSDLQSVPLCTKCPLEEGIAACASSYVRQGKTLGSIARA